MDNFVVLATRRVAERMRDPERPLPKVMSELIKLVQGPLPKPSRLTNDSWSMYIKEEGLGFQGYTIRAMLPRFDGDVCIVILHGPKDGLGPPLIYTATTSRWAFPTVDELRAGVYSPLERVSVELN